MARLPLLDFTLRWRPYELVPSSGQGRTIRKVRVRGSAPSAAHDVEAAAASVTTCCPSHGPGDGRLTGLSPPPDCALNAIELPSARQVDAYPPDCS